MVFIREDGLVVLTDSPPEKMSRFKDGRPVLEINAGWSHVMPKYVARNLADGFEETFNKLRPGGIVADALTDWRQQVATAVRSVKALSDQGGGMCFHRVALGGAALTHLGMNPRTVMGSMIFRVGQDEKLDTVAFSGPGNVAVVPGLFHVWLEVGGDIVDFSCGDWREDASLVEALSRRTETSEAGLRPINWEINPSEYIWQPSEELTSPWKPQGTPKLGEMWYREGARGRDSADV
jgi:hypothetical protein